MKMKNLVFMIAIIGLFSIAFIEYGKQEKTYMEISFNETMEFLGSETGKVVKIRNLIGTPSGQEFKFAEVSTDGSTNGHTTFPCDSGIHEGDQVLVTHVLNLEGPNRKRLRFMSKLKTEAQK